MNYGKAIRVVRAARGISQKDLAHRCDLDPSYVSLLETGARRPSMTTLELLAQKLAVPLYLLMLLGSERKDLRNVSQEQATMIGSHLLELLSGAEGQAKR